MKTVVHYSILYSIIVILIISLHVTFVSMPLKSMAQGKTQYKIVLYGNLTPTQQIQEILDQYSSQGWELVAVESVVGHFIFKK